MCVCLSALLPFSLSSPSWAHSWSLFLSFINPAVSLFLYHVLLAHSLSLSVCLSYLLLSFYQLVILVHAFIFFIFSPFFHFKFSTGTYSSLFDWAVVALWVHVLHLTSQERACCFITPQTTASPGHCFSTMLIKASMSQGTCVAQYFYDSVENLAHSSALLIVWRCKPPTHESVSVIYVYNEDKFSSVPAVWSKS